MIHLQREEGGGGEGIFISVIMPLCTCRCMGVHACMHAVGGSASVYPIPAFVVPHVAKWLTASRLELDMRMLCRCSSQLLLRWGGRGAHTAVQQFVHGLRGVMVGSSTAVAVMPPGRHGTSFGHGPA
jgi:hypothetical protein